MEEQTEPVFSAYLPSEEKGGVGSDEPEGLSSLGQGQGPLPEGSSELGKGEQQVAGQQTAEEAGSGSWFGTWWGTSGASTKTAPLPQPAPAPAPGPAAEVPPSPQEVAAVRNEPAFDMVTVCIQAPHEECQAREAALSRHVEELGLRNAWLEDALLQQARGADEARRESGTAKEQAKILQGALSREKQRVLKALVQARLAHARAREELEQQDHPAMGELSRAREQITALESRTDLLSSTVSSLKAKKKSLKKALTDNAREASSQAEQAQGRIEELEAHLREVEGQLKEAEAGKKAYLQKCTAQKGRLHVLEGQLTSTQAQLTEAIGTLDQWKAIVQTQSAASKADTAMIEQLREQLALAEEGARDWANSFHEADASRAELEGELRAREREVASLKERVRSAQAEEDIRNMKAMTGRMLRTGAPELAASGAEGATPLERTAVMQATKARAEATQAQTEAARLRTELKAAQDKAALLAQQARERELARTGSEVTATGVVVPKPSTTPPAVANTAPHREHLVPSSEEIKRIRSACRGHTMAYHRANLSDQLQTAFRAANGDCDAAVKILKEFSPLAFIDLEVSKLLADSDPQARAVIQGLLAAAARGVQGFVPYSQLLHGGSSQAESGPVSGQASGVTTGEGEDSAAGEAARAAQGSTGSSDRSQPVGLALLWFAPPSSVSSSGAGSGHGQGQGVAHHLLQTVASHIPSPLGRTARSISSGSAPSSFRISAYGVSTAPLPEGFGLPSMWRLRALGQGGAVSRPSGLPLKNIAVHGAAGVWPGTVLHTFILQHIPPGLYAPLFGTDLRDSEAATDTAWFTLCSPVSVPTSGTGAGAGALLLEVSNPGESPERWMAQYLSSIPERWSFVGNQASA